jgi:hypothetical protein
MCHGRLVDWKVSSRESARLSADVTIPMCCPLLICENSTCDGPTHVNPEAFFSQLRGSPLSTGTTQVSQPKTNERSPTTV